MPRTTNCQTKRLKQRKNKRKENIQSIKKNITKRIEERQPKKRAKGKSKQARRQSGIKNDIQGQVLMIYSQINLSELGETNRQARPTCVNPAVNPGG